MAKLSGFRYFHTIDFDGIEVKKAAMQIYVTPYNTPYLVPDCERIQYIKRVQIFRRLKNVKRKPPPIEQDAPATLLTTPVNYAWLQV
jgi:hypothetical protein